MSAHDTDHRAAPTPPHDKNSLSLECGARHERANPHTPPILTINDAVVGQKTLIQTIYYALVCQIITLFDRHRGRFILILYEIVISWSLFNLHWNAGRNL